MAGRGRGRGRGGAMAFTAEVLGLGRGDVLPPTTSQPPPLFPPLEFRPVPLPTGDEWDYLLLLKQEFRNTMRDSPYYIKPQDKKKDIERYSDKYRMSNNSDNTIGWTPDWNRLPKELKIRVKKQGETAARSAVKAVPNLQAAKQISQKDVEVVTQRLAELEQKETEAASGDEKQEDEDEEEIDEEEYYDEEDQEEGTDYIVSYFDNGEDDVNDDDDGLDDGPIY
ncbi:DNA-directed RNA polymerase III subunit RPC7-like [Patiria miniata]|uniref:DNA-directed RNA polymerase III subunit n=1 Tax=Patiria miniata TaxID=46514 RepID=A0A914BAP4_PATMI|nr:DNA-directed RNA polymerase III subunit RPC7-like [Patiria miniata]